MPNGCYVTTPEEWTTEPGDRYDIYAGVLLKKKNA